MQSGSRTRQRLDFPQKFSANPRESQSSRHRCERQKGGPTSAHLLRPPLQESPRPLPADVNAMSSSSSLLVILESSPGRGSTADKASGDEIAPPTKVTLSSAQKAVQATTPVYLETDIELLSVEAGRTLSPLLPAEEREVAEVPDANERKRELFRQIACSFSALTLYVLRFHRS